MTSIALQYGVPLKVLVDKFSHTRFEPCGLTNNPEIPFAKSMVDYIFRWMARGSCRPRRSGTRASRTPDGRESSRRRPMCRRSGGAPAQAGAPARRPATPAAIQSQDDAPSCTTAARS